MRSKRTSTWILAVVALLLTLPATFAISRADAGLFRADYVVDGVPLTVVAPDDEEDRPAVVVVHGFAGSSAIMDPIAVALARSGYRVVLPDLPGHGSNEQPIPLRADDTADRESLQSAIDTAVTWIVAQHGVIATQVGLVGHSMGADAVVRYASTHAGTGNAQGTIGATVAISLPSADGVPVGQPSVPRNLYLLWGSAEQARFSEAGIAAVRAAYPQAEPGRSYGDAADGSARGSQVVPGAEHITVVYSSVTSQAVVDWLDSTLAVGSPGHTVPADARLAWFGLLLVGIAVGFVPLARLLLGTGRGPSDGAPVVPAWRALVAMLVAAVAASLAGTVTTGRVVLPLLVADYAVVWFAVAGIVGGLLAWWWARGRIESRNENRASSNSDSGRVLRLVGATLALTAYLVAALALASRATWADFAVVGSRTWVLPVVEVALLIFFWADERLVARSSRWRRLLLVAANRVIVLAALLASVAVLGAPGVLTLWVGLLGLLLIMLAACGFVVSGLTRERWAVAVVQAIPLAYVVATSFPIVAS